MFPSGLIKRLLLVVFVIRTAAQHRIADDDFQPIRHLPPIAILPLDPIYLQKSATTNDDDEAGNGSALTVLDNLPETDSMLYTQSGQNPVNWYTIWLKEEQLRQKQKQKQKHRANFHNQNAALPFAQDNNRNTKFKSQTNGIDGNPYSRIGGNGCDVSENYGLNCAGVLLNESEENQQQDSAAEIKATKERKNQNDWLQFAASNYEQPKNFNQQQQQQHYLTHDSVKRQNWRSYKREKTHPERTAAFLPSISAGAMTNLGDFFRDLSKNIRFTEKSQLGQAELKLLEGNHPLGVLHEEWANSAVDSPATDASARKTEDFLHAIVNYRPSQKIRSLVSMNPRGYHGSQFLDPNYMWVGLGK